MASPRPITRKIRDLWGRLIAPFSKPDPKEIAAVALRDRWSTYPSQGLTPGGLAQVFLLADQGYPRPQAELFEDIEEKDAHIATCLQTRKLAVSGLDWEIQPFSESAEDKKIAEFCEEALKEINDIEDDFLDLLDAIAKGYSMAEIHWDTIGENGSKRIVPIDLKWIHSKKITFVNSLTPRILTDDDPVMGIDPPAWKTIYHRYRARSGFDMRAGTLRIIAYLYLLKIYAWKDWASFNEIYGIPLRIGKYPTGMSQPDKDALKEALRNLGADAAGIISADTEIQFVESTGRGQGRQNPFETLISRLNREISKAILGQTLTTDTEGSTGTYSAGKVHEGVRQDIVKADARSLQTTLRAQLLRPMVGFNFGWDKPVPKIKFDYEEGEDQKAVSEVVKNLSEAGFPFTAEYISERFGIPLPDENAKVTVLMPGKKAGETPQPTESKVGEEIPEGKEAGPGKGAGQEGGNGPKLTPEEEEEEEKRRKEAARLTPKDLDFEILWICQTCGTKANLEIHHEDGNSDNNKQENVKVFCHACHTSYESKKRALEKQTKASAEPLLEALELFKAMIPSVDDPIVRNELKAIQIIEENEEAIAQALEQAAPVIGRMLAPIKDLVDKSRSIEEVQRKLVEVYPKLPKKELATLLWQTMMIAWMKGAAGDFGRLEQ